MCTILRKKQEWTILLSLALAVVGLTSAIANQPNVNGDVGFVFNLPVDDSIQLRATPVMGSEAGELTLRVDLINKSAKTLTISGMDLPWYSGFDSRNLVSTKNGKLTQLELVFLSVNPSHEIIAVCPGSVLTGELRCHHVASGQYSVVGLFSVKTQSHGLIAVPLQPVTFEYKGTKENGLRDK